MSFSAPPKTSKNLKETSPNPKETSVEPHGNLLQPPRNLEQPRWTTRYSASGGSVLPPELVPPVGRDTMCYAPSRGSAPSIVNSGRRIRRGADEGEDGERGASCGGGRKEH